MKKKIKKIMKLKQNNFFLFFLNYLKNINLYSNKLYSIINVNFGNK